jgi:hypothetical protein
MVPSVSTMLSECKPANGPSSISRPLVLPKFPELKSDKLRFQVLQHHKNVLSKGKSLETQYRSVF